MFSDFWLIAIILIFSAFCSGLEISFFSANKLKLEIDRQQGKWYTHFINVFLRKRGQFISTILVGNNIALVLYGIVVNKMLIASLTGSFSYIWQLVFNSVISAAIMLVLSDIVPKTACRMMPNFFLQLFSFPAYLLYCVCYPLSKFCTWASVMFLKYVLRQKVEKPAEDKHYFDRVDLLHLTAEAAEGVENREEELEHDIQIFRNALDFSEVKVRDCMVPRTEIEAIEMSESMANLRQIFIRTGYSRILVYKDSIDSVIGYVRSTDLFKHYESIRKMQISLLFVPESMSAQKLLTLFIKNKKSVAVVLDEFGVTAGMVTMEDVMEEIFGEIEDEHDSNQFMEKQISDNQFVFSGRLEVLYINENYDIGLPESDDYDTLAGFIIFAGERIPKTGEELEIEGFKIRILKTISSRIELIQLTLPEKS